MLYIIYMMFDVYMGVSKNRCIPKSSILIGFSIINHPFWGTPFFGNTHIYIYTFHIGTGNIPTPTSTLCLLCHYCKLAATSTKKTVVECVYCKNVKHFTGNPFNICDKMIRKNPSGLFDSISFLLLIAFC